MKPVPEHEHNVSTRTANTLTVLMIGMLVLYLGPLTIFKVELDKN